MRRVKATGFTLPSPPKPVGAYSRAVRTGNLIFVSGQLPLVAGCMKFTGKIGRELSIEQGYEASRICALNALSILKSECGSLDNVVRIVRVSGFVSSADGFIDQPKVVNGASELFNKILGERGRHARVAIGVNELPMGAPVELEVIAEIL